MTKREYNEDEDDDEEDGYRQMLKGRRAKIARKELTPSPAPSPVNPPRKRTDSADTHTTNDPKPSTLYLETIDRSRLDFDFEKLCSVSLSNNNVYACLTCGKYFQGRGKSSHAAFHSIDQNHHVYINLQTLKVYVLPDGYEVVAAGLDDIKYVADPKYTKQEVLKLDSNKDVAHDLAHNEYRPGFMGMNNIKENDYANVVLQALAHITPLRNFFMLEPFKAEILKRLSVLVRKLWNPKAFKPHVSPHELLQHIALVSNKRFTPTTQRDPAEFLNWLVQNLHLALGGSRSKPQSSIIQKVFQGRLQIQTQEVSATASDFEDGMTTKEVPFMFLTLDLPPAPLFKGGDLDQNTIPQVLLTSLLAKYNGHKIQELAGQRHRYKLLQLPPFLTLHIKRFNKTNLVDKRNPTVVSFGPQNLDMSPYVADHPEGTPIYYDLVANITHELVTAPSAASDGASTDKHVWSVQMLDKARQKWVVMQDLLVQDVRAELLFLSESYIQIWERRK